MNIEQQVCSLDLAKRLKELGVRQESEHWWVESYDYAYKGRSWWLCRTRDEDDAVNPHVSAFTVAELGEMLPPYCDSMRMKPEYQKNHNAKWYCEYDQMHIEKITIYADTEADARAKMRIYLLENKLVTV